MDKENSSYISFTSICHLWVGNRNCSTLNFRKTIYSSIHLSTQLYISVSYTKCMHHILSLFFLCFLLFKNQKKCHITLIFAFIQIKDNKRLAILYISNAYIQTYYSNNISMNSFSNVVLFSDIMCFLESISSLEWILRNTYP